MALFRIPSVHVSLRDVTSTFLDHPIACVYSHKHRCAVKSRANTASEQEGQDSLGFGNKKAPVKKGKTNNKEQLQTSQVDAFLSRLEYEAYFDAALKARSFIGPIELRKMADKGRGLVTKGKLMNGDLLLASPALASISGSFDSAPTVSDLHASVLKNGLTPGQIHALSLLYDGTEESMALEVSLQDLDVSKGGKQPGRRAAGSAGSVDAKHLMSVLENCAASDVQQDATLSQARKEVPAGYIGLWPIHSFMNHSCVPNTSTAVVGSTMFVHAARALEAGSELTRSYLNSTSLFSPLSVRRADLTSSCGFVCRCERCTLEETAPEEVRQCLESAHSWWRDVAQTSWDRAVGAEDLDAATALRDEAETWVGKLEQAMEDASISEEQRDWLRADLYDIYDFLVVCDELFDVTEEDDEDSPWARCCLDILRAVIPGSDGHVMLALKLELGMQMRAEGVQSLLAARPRSRQLVRRMRKAAEEFQEYTALMFEALVTRYGYHSIERLQELREGLLAYLEGVARMEQMAAGDTGQDVAAEVEMDGVKLSVIDTIGTEMTTASKGMKLAQADGIRLSLLSDKDS